MAQKLSTVRQVEDAPASADVLTGGGQGRPLARAGRKAPSQAGSAKDHATGSGQDLAQRLKALEAENARLQRLVSEMIRERRTLPALEDPSPDFSEALRNLWRWSNRGCARMAKLAGLQIEVATLNILEILAPQGPMRIVDLAARLQLDGSTVSRQVAAAVAAGYVDRFTHPEGPREALLSVSDSGKWVLEQLVDAWRQIGVRFMSDWSHSDQARIVELLEKLAQRLNRDIDG